MLLSFKLFLLLISEIILINCNENEYINTRTLLSDDHNTLTQQRSSKLSPTIILAPTELSSSDNTIELESQIKKLQIMNEIYSITKIYSVFKNHKPQFELTQIDTNHEYKSTCDFMDTWAGESVAGKRVAGEWKCDIQSGLLIWLRFNDYKNGRLNINPDDIHLYGTVNSEFWSYISKLTKLQKLRILSSSATWSSEYIDGTVDWDAISQMTSLIELEISHNKINGSIELSKLPHSLQDLHLNINQFDGSIDLLNDLRELKRIHGKIVSLKTLNLNNNQLTGKIGNFEGIPESITSIGLAYNNFKGTVDFSGLTSSLSKLYLNNNNLSGTINLNDVVKSNLKRLSLDVNHFTDVIQYNGNVRDIEISY